MTKPTVFISHRHADKAVARVVSKFLRERSSGKATVFCSSSAEFDTPTPGESLEVSLKRALAASDVVVLVFTTDTEDWSYCMWECGLATDPEDKRPTKVVVLQCGESSPKPYVDHVRVDVRSLDSVTGFVKTMLTSAEYFPIHGQALTEFVAEDDGIKEFAAELHAKLGEVLGALRHGDVEERSASTYLCVELERDAVEQVRSCYGMGDDDGADEIVRTATRVVAKRGARALFGFHVDDTTSLGKIVDEWSAAQLPAGGDGAGDSATSPRWFRSVVDQIGAVASGRFPVVKWAPYDVVPSKAVIPFVAGCRTVPATGGLQLQIYFVPMSPRPVPVTERMIGLESMFHKNLADTPGKDIGLAELLNEMKADRRSRVPMLGEEGRPKFIVHRSMITDLVSDRTLNGPPIETPLTVHDLLAKAESAALGTSTFAVVDASADMDQALAAMNAIEGCQDVFVTTDGGMDGAVVGWLTNTMFTS